MEPMKADLRGQTALVTGADRGIYIRRGGSQPF